MVDCCFFVLGCWVLRLCLWVSFKLIDLVYVMVLLVLSCLFDLLLPRFPVIGVCFVFGRYCCLCCFNSVVYTLLIVSLLLVWFSCWWWLGGALLV